MDPVNPSSWRCALVVLVGLTGCSLALTGPDSKQARTKSPACDRTKGFVALDGIVSGLTGLTGLALLADDEREAAAFPLVFSAVYALAATYGNNTVNECRAAVAKYEDSVRVNDLAGMPEKALPGRAKRASLERHSRSESTKDARTGAPAEAPVEPPVAQVHQTAPSVVPPPVTAPVAPKPTPQPVAPSPPVKPPPPPPSDPWRDFWQEVP